jgi:hypothetical protein
MPLFRPSSLGPVTGILLGLGLYYGWRLASRIPMALLVLFIPLLALYGPPPACSWDCGTEI